MAASVFNIMVIVLVSVSCVMMVSCIKCYQCNSNTNSQCFNLENYENKNYTMMPTTCNETEYGPKPFCRKTVLKYFDEKKTQVRIIRSCGMIPSKEECYTANNEGHQEKVCQCFEDGCNGSMSLFPKFLMMSLTIFLPILSMGTLC